MSKEFPWYTGEGDDGTTGLLGEGRVPKHHPQPEAFGDVDEASSAIGWCRSIVPQQEVADVLLRVQRDCYAVMAELAATPEAQEKFRKIDDARVDWLAKTADAFGARVKMPREFVVPGDSREGAALDVARTVVRRAERRVTRLLEDGTMANRSLQAYLNRLSSLLFVLARFCDAASGNSSVTLAKE